MFGFDLELAVTDTGSSLFKVTESQITSSLPHAFLGSGDVSIANDLNFTNDTASYITFNQPGYIRTYHPANDYNLTLSAANNGVVYIDDSLQLIGNQTMSDDGWLGLGSGAGRIEFDDQTTDEINFLNTNVGIGTTAPSELLYLSGSNDNIVINNTDTGSSGVLYSANGIARIQTYLNATTNDYYIDSTNGGIDPSITVDYTTGYVGIGNTAPAYALDVSGELGFSGGLRKSDDTDTLFWDGDDAWFLHAGGVRLLSVIETDQDMVVIGRDDIVQDVDFKVNGLNGDSFFVQGSSGNVGIGTTAPLSVLQIDSGQITVANGTAAAPSYSFSENTGMGFYKATSSQIGVSPYGTARYLFGDSNFAIASDRGLGWTQSASPHDTFDTNLTRIGASVLALGNGTQGDYTGTLAVGSLGIGTTNPGELLDVNGNIKLNNGNKLVWGSNTNEYIGESGDAINYVSYSNQRIHLDSNNDGAGANVFAVMTGGIPGAASELFRVQTSGVVGIGTTVPNYKLSVYDATLNTLAEFKSGDNRSLILISDDDTTYSSGVEDGAYYLGSGVVGLSTSQLVLTSGDLGIGTTAPSARLTVNQASPSANELLFNVQNTDANVFSVDAEGDFFYDGTGTSPAADVAENYPVAEDGIQPGHIVALVEKDGTFAVARAVANPANLAHLDKPVLGIISTDPALLLGGSAKQNSTTQVPVALTGRVPVKYSNANGPIKIGDRLTTSSEPGVAVRYTGTGPIVGLALENADQSGEVLVFVDGGVTSQASVNNVIPERQSEASTLSGIPSGSSTNSDDPNGIPHQVREDGLLHKDDATTGLSPELQTLIADTIATSLTDFFTAQDLHITSDELETELGALILEEDQPAIISNSLALLGDEILIDGQLSVYDTTNLSDTYINGSLNIATSIATYTLDDTGLSALDDKLYLQPTGLHGIDLMAGLLVLDTNGQVIITGDLTVTGSIIADRIEATGSAVLGTTTAQSIQTEQLLVSNQIAGIATIPAGQTSVTLQFAQPFADTPLVMLTPKSAIAGYFLTGETATQFTIQITSPLATDTSFNWIAIGVVGEQETTQAPVIPEQQSEATTVSGIPSETAEAIQTPVIASGDEVGARQSGLIQDSSTSDGIASYPRNDAATDGIATSPTPRNDLTPDDPYATPIHESQIPDSEE